MLCSSTSPTSAQRYWLCRRAEKLIYFDEVNAEFVVDLIHGVPLSYSSARNLHIYRYSAGHASVQDVCRPLNGITVKMPR